ncbi:MAG: hypothetical protein ACOX4H_12095 [Bacillota bacterium]|nr:hypothetical protein [Clostridia bacterium]
MKIIAFSVVGLVILVNTLPLLVTAVMRSILIYSWEVGDIINIGSYVLKILLSMWLLLGSRGVVGLIRSARTAGLRK